MDYSITYYRYKELERKVREVTISNEEACKLLGVSVGTNKVHRIILPWEYPYITREITTTKPKYIAPFLGTKDATAALRDEGTIRFGRINTGMTVEVWLFMKGIEIAPLLPPPLQIDVIERTLNKGRSPIAIYQALLEEGVNKLLAIWYVPVLIGLITYSTLDIPVYGADVVDIRVPFYISNSLDKLLVDIVREGYIVLLPVTTTKYHTINHGSKYQMYISNNIVVKSIGTKWSFVYGTRAEGKTIRVVDGIYVVNKLLQSGYVSAPFLSLFAISEEKLGDKFIQLKNMLSTINITKQRTTLRHSVSTKQQDIMELRWREICGTSGEPTIKEREELRTVFKALGIENKYKTGMSKESICTLLKRYYAII